MTTERQGHTFKVYSVKDELVGKFLQPVFLESDQEAIRWFKHVVNNTQLWKDNAAMFTLYRLGNFNDNIGFIKTENEMIQGGLSVVEKED